MTQLLYFLLIWYGIGAVATVATVVAALRSRADYYIGYTEEEPETDDQKQHSTFYITRIGDLVYSPKPSPPPPPPATLITPNPVKIKVGSSLYARLSGGGLGILSVNGETRISNTVVEHGGKKFFANLELDETMQDDDFSIKEAEMVIDSKLAEIKEELERIRKKVKEA